MGFFRPPKMVYRQLLVLDPHAPVPKGFSPDLDIDVTSRSRSIGRQLSPFLLGPVTAPSGETAQCIEGLWQYSKCYGEHWDAAREQPLPEWWEWRAAGFEDPVTQRYPMGKGARPVCSWWEGRALGVVEARETIYRPHYLRHALETGAWRWLLREARRGKRILLRDFGAFDGVVAGVPFDETLSDPMLPFCHAVLLAAELEACLSRP